MNYGETKSLKQFKFTFNSLNHKLSKDAGTSFITVERPQILVQHLLELESLRSK